MTPQKIKIMNTQPPITDEEIRSFMDFDQLLAAQKSAVAQKKAKAKTIRIIAVTMVIVAVSVISYLNIQWKESNTITPPSTNPKEGSAVKPSSGNDNTLKEQPSTRDKSEEDKTRRKGTSKKSVLQDNPVSKKDRKTGVTPDSSYVEAEPVAGFPELYTYFNRELKYPDVAVKDSLQGVITVSFILTREGKPAQVKTVNSLGPAFDQEAFRVIEKMPAWKPARINGNPVASRISLPLTFHLKRVNPK